MPSVIFNIATVERRQKSFISVLLALAKQSMRCDLINVALSYTDRRKVDAIREILKSWFPDYTMTVGNFTAAHKMFALDSAPDKSYFLTFDDDIYYPPDYVHELCRHINRYKHKSVIGFHGMTFDTFPVINFYKRKLYQYFAAVQSDVNVHVIGTGCSGFHVETLREKGFSYSYFADFPEHGNWNDMTFAQFLRENKIPMTVVAHRKDWMKIIPGTQDGQALWKQKEKTVELQYLQA